MARFAHVFQNIVYDPQDNATLADYKNRFGDLTQQWASHVFKQVADDTVQGAVDNGNGTFTNPVAPTKPTVPIIMTDKQFRKFVTQQLGVGAYGLAFKTASVSNDGTVLDAYAAWAKAQTYEKSDVAQFTAALVAAGILTAQQRTLLVGNNNWPEV